MTRYKEKPRCRSIIETYLEKGFSLYDLLDTSNISLSSGLRTQVKKMIIEEEVQR